MNSSPIDSANSESAYWTHEQVLESGEATLDCWIQQIRQARSSIDFEVYIYHQDLCGDAFAQVLSHAARRGVKTRVLVDGIGALGFTTHYQQALEEAGVHVKVYHPTPFDVSDDSFWWWLPWRFWKLMGILNKRNHRKVLLVDGETAVLGSVNVSRSHLSVERGGLGWRDLGVLVRGPGVKSIRVAFERTWKYANKIALSPAPQVPLVPAMFNFSGKMRRLRYLFFLELIYRANQRIWITNAYFVPDGSLLKALRFAAWSGADVKIIVPQKSDVIFMRMVSSAFYLGLLAAGVRIFEYLPSVLHSKTLLIDDLGVIGTSNLNHRSLLHDLEVDAILTKEESIAALTRSFAKDLENCKEVTIKDWESMSWWERAIGNLLLSIRYWL